MTIVRLANEHWSLVILPEKGGCIVSAECNGFPVLRTAEPQQIDAGNIFVSSCFPLVPFSNRIAGGMFSFNSQTYRLSRNHPDNKFPIHGYGWQAVWRVSDLTETHCEMSMIHKAKAGNWPWSFEARQKISIKGRSVQLEISITNIDKTPFPAGLGMHPSFSGSDRARVKFKTGNMWACDESLIPTKLVPLTTSRDFSEFTAIKDTALDNCFEGWSGHAEIIWPEFDGVIHMKGGTNFSHLVVYCDPQNDYFCLEPTTHANNAINMTDAGGMTNLSPNMSLQESVQIIHNPKTFEHIS